MRKISTSIQIIIVTIFSLSFLPGKAVDFPLCYLLEDTLNGRVDTLYELSLEELLKVKVITPGKYLQEIKNVPASVEIITAEDIKRRGYTNIEEVLHDLPGFNFSKANGINLSTIYTRGYREDNTERTILMIDGVVENDLWKGVAWLDKQYALSNIKRIEILYGPASALYGAYAFQGIINIITKDGADNKNLVNYTGGYGSYNTFIQELMIGKKWKELDYNITFRKYDSEEMDLSKYEEWDYKVPAGENFVFPVNKYSNVKDDIFLHLKARYRNFTMGSVWWDRKDESGATYVDAYLSGQKYANVLDKPWDIRNMNFYTQYEAEILRGLRSKTRFTFFRHEHLPTSKTFYLTYLDSANQQAKVRYWHELSKRFFMEQQFSYYKEFGPVKNNLILGFEFKDSYLQGNYFFQDLFYPVNGTVPSIPEVGTPEIIDQIDYATFIQNTITPVKNINIILGTRYDNNKVRYFGGYGGVFSPRLGLVYSINSKLNVKLLYTEGFSPATNWELYSTTATRIASRKLPPEIAKSKEASISYKLGQKVFIEAAFYYNNYSDRRIVKIYPAGYLDPSKPEINEQVETVGNWTIWGNESRILLKAKKFSSYLNYSYSMPYDDDTRKKVGNIGHTANAGINYAFSSKLNFNIRSNWVSKRPSFTRDSQGNFLSYIDPYTILNATILIHNLFVNNKYANGLGMSFSLNNIFNQEYFDPGLRTGTAKYPSRLPQNGRNYFIRLYYSFGS